ncbi:NAD-dependent epimerase/dehydratase family protein [Nocardia sp. NBC_00511]|uniref:NAD-dependent epimerase/dehydratase family protein n=1 Tax=Nocardia sp. NBC_00511 TaxID=2903591 RepID=UPI0030E249FA
MKIFVAGGTGAIGRYVVPSLVNSGHEVTALARTADKAVWLAGHDATPELSSLFDREPLTAVVAGHDAVVNMATALPGTLSFLSDKAWRRNEYVRIAGSTALADAALAAGVGRFVQESVAMVYPDRGADWIDEDQSVDHYPRARCSFAAEANAQRLTDAGGTGIVLRFGVFLGAGAEHSEMILAAAQRHIATVLGPPGNYTSSIQLDDAAAAVVAALTAPAGIYNVVDDEPLTKRDYAAAAAMAAKTKPWLWLPGRLAQLGGDRSTSLTRSLRVSNKRFRAVAGWSPRYPSAREAWQAMAATPTAS